MHDLRKAIAWMSGTLVCFCGLALSVRALSGEFGVFQVLALRNLSGVAILAAYGMVTTGRRIRGPFPVRIHLLRNVVHFAAQAAWAYGITVLPLATVFALEFTSPAWTLVLAVLFLHERLTVPRIGAVVLGFAGVMIILRPGFLGFAAGGFHPEGLVVLAAAVGFAVQLTATKFLTGTNSVLNILFWMNVLQLPLNILADLVVRHGVWVTPVIHAHAVLPLIVLCVSGLLAHICLTNAFRHGDAATVVPIDFLRIPAIAVVGAAFYHEAFDPWVLLGAGVSAAGIVWSLRAVRIRHVEQGKEGGGKAPLALR